MLFVQQPMLLLLKRSISYIFGATKLCLESLFTKTGTDSTGVSVEKNDLWIL